MVGMRIAFEGLLSLSLCCIAVAQAPIVDSRIEGSSTSVGAVAERSAPVAAPDDPVLMLARSPAPPLNETLSLREALQRIARKSGVPVHGIWKSGGGQDALDPDRHIMIEIPIRTCAEALDAIADLVSREGEPVRWQAARVGVEFGRRSSLWRAAALHIRVYDVRDLLLLKPAFVAMSVPLPGAGASGGGGSGDGSNGGVVDPAAAARQAAQQNDLVTLIQLTVEPEAWEIRGGPCTIVPRDGLLVIRAPDFVHRQIESPRPPPRSSPRTSTTPVAGSRGP
jgi:hypothetical protein